METYFSLKQQSFSGMRALLIRQENLSDKIDILIRGFQFSRHITKEDNNFVGIYNSWIALPTKNTKLNVQR